MNPIQIQPWYLLLSPFFKSNLWKAQVKAAKQVFAGIKYISLGIYFLQGKTHETKKKKRKKNLQLFL